MNLSMSLAWTEFAGVTEALEKISKSENPNDHGKSHLSSHLTEYPGSFVFSVDWKAISSNNFYSLE